MKNYHVKRKFIYILITVTLILTLSLTVLADTLFIEAESGTPDAADPMLTGSGSGAYGDKYIYGENNGVEKISYEFTLQEAGDYYIWFRMMGQDDNSNSFFVKVDGSGFNQDTGNTKDEYYTFDMWEPSEGFDYAVNNPFLPTLEHMKDPVWCYNPNWHWIPLSYRDATGATPVRFDLVKLTLAAGKHTMDIMTREPGAYLDKIVITNDLTYDLTKMDSDPQDPQTAYLAAQTAAPAAATDAATTEAPATVAAVTEQVTVQTTSVQSAPAPAIVSAVQTSDDGLIYGLIFIFAAISSAVVIAVRRRKPQI